MKHEDWWFDARCRGLPIDVFFPNTNADTRFDQAKEVCRLCRVKRQCLNLQIHLPDHDDRWGVFGGMTPFERYMERKRRSGE